MLRRPFDLSAALSLLLFLAVCALWARSYWAKDTLSLWTHRFVVAFHNGGGTMAVSLATGTFNPDSPTARSNGLHYDRDDPRKVVPTPGADYFVYPVSHPDDWAGTLRVAGAVHWLLATVASFLPLAWLDRHVRARRRRLPPPSLRESERL